MGRMLAFEMVWTLNSLNVYVFFRISITTEYARDLRNATECYGVPQCATQFHNQLRSRVTDFNGMPQIATLSLSVLRSAT